MLAGQSEARLAALGVLSSIYNADGLVGDLGGGSLEMTEIADGRIGQGITLPLGGLSLMDVSERSPRKAARIAREALARARVIGEGKGRAFYAVGGTWRALARLHMRERDYPMHVMHNYVIPAQEALEFVKLVERVEADVLPAIESIAPPRRPLLAYGAAVLEEIVRLWEPREIVVSALGVREGLLYESLSPADQAKDPLIERARDFNRLRSRAPAHAEDLFDWIGEFLESSHLDETPDDRRLRYAACLLIRRSLASASRLSRRAVARHDRQLQSDRPRSSLARLSRALGVLPPCDGRREHRTDVALAHKLAPARARAHSRRGDAGRLHPLRGYARRLAARAYDVARRQGYDFVAAGVGGAQQRAFTDSS